MTWAEAYPCGCSIAEGRCEGHAGMMKAIHEVWNNGRGEVLGRIWNESDGYGEPGLVPPQGYDWSGIRDSSPEAVERMFAALPS